MTQRHPWEQQSFSPQPQPHQINLQVLVHRAQNDPAGKKAQLSGAATIVVVAMTLLVEPNQMEVTGKATVS